MKSPSIRYALVVVFTLVICLVAGGMLSMSTRIWLLEPSVSGGVLPFALALLYTGLLALPWRLAPDRTIGLRVSTAIAVVCGMLFMTPAASMMDSDRSTALIFIQFNIIVLSALVYAVFIDRVETTAEQP